MAYKTRKKQHQNQNKIKKHSNTYTSKRYVRGGAGVTSKLEPVKQAFFKSYTFIQGLQKQETDLNKFQISIQNIKEEILRAYPGKQDFLTEDIGGITKILRECDELYAKDDNKFKYMIYNVLITEQDLLKKHSIEAYYQHVLPTEINDAEFNERIKKIVSVLKPSLGNDKDRQNRFLGMFCILARIRLRTYAYMADKKDSPDPRTIDTSIDFIKTLKKYDATLEPVFQKYLVMIKDSKGYENMTQVLNAFIGECTNMNGASVNSNLGSRSIVPFGSMDSLGSLGNPSDYLGRSADYLGRSFGNAASSVASSMPSVESAAGYLGNFASKGASQLGQMVKYPGRYAGFQNSVNESSTFTPSQPKRGVLPHEPDTRPTPSVRRFKNTRLPSSENGAPNQSGQSNESASNNGTFSESNNRLPFSNVYNKFNNSGSSFTTSEDRPGPRVGLGVGRLMGNAPSFSREEESQDDSVVVQKSPKSV